MTKKQTFNISEEAMMALTAIQKTLNDSVLSILLTGSSILGGLHQQSDVDILVITKQSLSSAQRFSLSQTLLAISGKVGNQNGVHPLEVTVVCASNIAPWVYPPYRDYIYGEWLRNDFEAGHIEGPSKSPDLAIFLAQARDFSYCLWGSPLQEWLAPIPKCDIIQAIRDTLPDLIKATIGDERNVLLTLARGWYLLCEGEFVSKDRAAQ